jgi:hypothetical protein
MTCTFVSRPRAAALSLVITALASSLANAQTPVPVPITGASIQPTSLGTPAFTRALQGKSVWITTSDGFRGRGVVTSLSATGMVVTDNGSTTTVPFGDVVKVEKASHRLRNGTLIGLASGAGFGVMIGALLCEGDCSAGEFAGISLAAGGLYGGMGAGIGVGIGALVNAAKRHGDVVYDAKRRTTTVAVSPILSPTRKGMAFSMTWR